VPRRPPETRYAQSTGAKIAYQVAGDRPPDIVLVPGFVSHLELRWQNLAQRRFDRALARSCRLIQFDKRGTGLSDPTTDLPTTAQRVDDLAAVMNAARSRRAVVLGLSDGARAAIAFAAAHPERVLGLVLYGASYRGPDAARMRVYRSMVRHWGEGRIVDAFAPSLACEEARRAAGAFERAAASPAMARALIESLGLLDVRDLMAELRVPVLVLHREGDPLPLADGRAVGERIPGARLVVLPGRDHLPWVGDWASVADQVLAFAAGVAPASRRAAAPLPASSTARRPLVGWPSLTDAELPVVRLVAQGLSNRAIAEQLFLSHYTVETHLKHVFAKLGVESRAEPAALAVARDVAPNT
jgi:pimeloyl-ACP methyl ester carboxylesterase/DNA-binding CsgD family transcriptional regulator